MKKEDTQGKDERQIILGQVREKMNLRRHREKDPAEGKSKFAVMCQFV